MKKQVISKDEKIFCQTIIPYSADTVKAMKKAGYKIKEINEKDV